MTVRFVVHCGSINRISIDLQKDWTDVVRHAAIKITEHSPLEKHGIQGFLP